MKKELGIARCGLACCLCSENGDCNGCHADDCVGALGCEVRKCCLGKGIGHCFECHEAEKCQKGILSKLKPRAFTLFAQKYGMCRLMECLEINEKRGIVYHRSGITGDYDECSDINEVLRLIEEGKLHCLQKEHRP